MDQFQHHKLFVDVGNHFRCCRLLGWWGRHLLEQRPTVKSTHLIMFPEHHGKGPPDGQGGRINQWIELSAKKEVIGGSDDFVRVLNERAREHREQNPRAPESIFIKFEPPRRNTLPKTSLCLKHLEKSGMPMKSTYVYSAEMVLDRPMLYAHSLCQAEACSSCRPFWAAQQPADLEEWRTAHRKLQPE
eukprot:9615374-Karenia_brevis.AAC.1